MFSLREPTKKIFGARYIYYKPRKFPWSPYLKDKVHRYPSPKEDESLPAEYPNIEDLSPRAHDLRLRQIFYNKIEKLDTVEEKLMALNLPKFYGWPNFHIKDDVIPYDYLPLAQFITRTVISENNKLISFEKGEHLRPLINLLKKELEKVLIFEHHGRRHKHEIEKIFIEEEKQNYLSETDIDKIKTRHIVKQLNSALMRVLSSQYPHLLKLQINYDPRIEAFWRVGGFHLTHEDRKLRKAKKIDKSLKHDPIDRFFQYFGSPLLQLRSQLPLREFPKLDWQVPTEVVADDKPVEEESVKSEDTNIVEQNISDAVEKDPRIYPLQSYKYRPDIYLQLPRERGHGAVIPGFWPNDPYRFGFLSYHSSNHINSRPEFWGSEERQEALHAQALIASFAFCYGQACYQGFSTYNDVTYPFTSQSILTDGHRFSFYQYQLNTTVLHSDHTENTNPLYNVCYATPEQELYHSVENDKVTGWNDEVLLNLFALYKNIPETKESIDLCPYLNKETRFVSQIDDKKKRIWIHNRYRHLTAHRALKNDHSAEIYDWERIFKIDHKIRVTDARKRHFEKFEDWLNDRKLNEHHSNYIPKELREPGRAHRDKFEDTYYPDVFPDYHEIV